MRGAEEFYLSWSFGLIGLSLNLSLVIAPYTTLPTNGMQLQACLVCVGYGSSRL